MFNFFFKTWIIVKWFGVNKRGPCRGICVNYRAQKPASGGRYEIGQARCQVCDIYLNEDGLTAGKDNPSGELLYCKCCGYRVRKTPRNKIYKEKFRGGLFSKAGLFRFQNNKSNTSQVRDSENIVDKLLNDIDHDVVVHHECPQCHRLAYRLSEAVEIFGTTTSRVTKIDPYGLQSWCKACRTKYKSDDLFSTGEKSFSDLRDFIESEMILKANYQLVMLNYLLEQRTGTRREIAKELARQNHENDFDPKIIQKYLYVPVYEVLLKRGFVKEALNDIFLNVTLSYDARFEIQEILKRKILEYNKLSGIQEVTTSNVNSTETTSPELFTAVGPWSNWQWAISNSPMKWGVDDNSPALADFELLKPGDFVFYYVTQGEPSPFNRRGFFGVGEVLRKYIQKEIYWPDEVSENRVIYSYRFDLETKHIVDDDGEILPWIDGLPFTKGLNHIANEQIQDKLLQNLQTTWLDVTEMTSTLDSDDYESQLNEQEEKIKQNPKDENAWYQKARILAILGREEESIYALIVVTSIYPESKDKLQFDDAFDKIKNSEMFKMLKEN